MADRWLQLCDTGGDPWVFPIWTSLNQAKEAGRALRITAEMGEMALHVSTRLTMIPRVISRLNKDLLALFDAAAAYKPEHVFSKSKNAVALSINDDIKFCVFTDVNSFLFEINACTELIGKFFQLLHAHVGKPIPDDMVSKRLKITLEHHGVPKRWFKKLSQARNFAAHNGTPYVAIDISQSAKWDAIFMMENLKCFDDHKQFFNISDLQEIATGFDDAKRALQNHFLELFHSI
jgi:hypothetical protein